MPLFLLYFIILTNLYCAKTLNMVLSFVIDVHFVMDELLVFSKMWQFPYPFGFCNPVWIYGRKINDDDVLWCDPSARKCNPTQHRSHTRTAAVVSLVTSRAYLPLFWLLKQHLGGHQIPE